MDGLRLFVDDGLSSSNICRGQAQLVVVVAIDQLRRDGLDASMPGGLGKILSGRQFIEEQLDHGITNTCPGHVVMLTGANPSAAGVPNNSLLIGKLLSPATVWMIETQKPE